VLSNEWKLPLGYAGLIPTANAMGYMLANPSSLIKDAVAFAKSKPDTHFVDIGAAYGVATQYALEEGLEGVVAVEPGEEHIAYMQTQFVNKVNQFVCVCDSMPCQLPLEDDSVSVFLLSRVLHFFSKEEVENSLVIMKRYLMPGGRFYVQTLSPYVKLFDSFILEFEAKVKANEPAPGVINNLQSYLGDKDAGHNPDFFHVFSVDTLQQVFIENGFNIIEARYETSVVYPESMKLDGREDVVLIAEYSGG
tara:strand:- start:379 stop:1128 length:750 start_codon:yes stop_codon:yes gene_type:complete